MAAALPLEVIVHCCMRYLSSQRVVVPSAAISAVVALLRPALNHALIHWAGLGMLGAPLAFVMAHALSSSLYAAAVTWHNFR